MNELGEVVADAPNLQFEQPPDQLVSSGKQLYGRFNAAPRRANLIDREYLGLPRALRWFRLKEWQAVQVSTPRFFMNLALFDAKLLSLVQIKLYDRLRKQKHVFEKKLPPGRLRIADSLYDFQNAYSGNGVRLSFDNRLDLGRIHVVLDLAAEAGRPRISGGFSLLCDRGAPQVVSLPFPRGGMYSNKGMFPVQGRLSLDGELCELAPHTSLALLDDHKGYYPYVMRWDWLTSAHFGEDGVPRGFNLTRNQCVSPERFNENCAWLGAKVGALPAVQFTRSQTADGELWRAQDTEGRVDVCFRPTVPGRVSVNALVVESRYQGPFGTFEGVLRPFGLPECNVDGWFGMGEDFHLRC